jgi:hypothetical protein
MDDGRRFDIGPGAPAFALLAGEYWLMAHAVTRTLLDVDRYPDLTRDATAWDQVVRLP